MQSTISDNIDVVCNTTLEGYTKHQTALNGKIYYFCCIGCKLAFESNPKQFIKE